MYKQFIHSNLGVMWSSTSELYKPIWLTYLIFSLLFILVYSPVFSIIAVSQFVGANELYMTKIFCSLCNDASHFGWNKKIHLKKKKKNTCFKCNNQVVNLQVFWSQENKTTYILKLKICLFLFWNQWLSLLLAYNFDIATGLI